MTSPEKKHTNVRAQIRNAEWVVGKRTQLIFKLSDIAAVSIPVSKVRYSHWAEFLARILIIDPGLEDRMPPVPRTVSEGVYPAGEFDGIEADWAQFDLARPGRDPYVIDAWLPIMGDVVGGML